ARVRGADRDEGAPRAAAPLAKGRGRRVEDAAIGGAGRQPRVRDPPLDRLEREAEERDRMAPAPQLARDVRGHDAGPRPPRRSRRGGPREGLKRPRIRWYPRAAPGRR